MHAGHLLHCSMQTRPRPVVCQPVSCSLVVQATTSFIEQHPELFHFSTRDSSSAAKLLSYLAELVSLIPAISVKSHCKAE